MGDRIVLQPSKYISFPEEMYAYHESLFYELTNQLTTYSRVPLDTLIVAQLVSKLPASYDNQRIVTMLTAAHC